MAAHLFGFTGRREGRIAVPVKVWNAVGIGQRLVADEDPGPPVLLSHGVTRHFGVGGRLRLAGHMDALSRAIEPKAMIGALDFIADAPASGKRDVPMRAPVFQRHKSPPVGATEHDDALAEDGPGDETRIELVGPANHIPAISQKCHRTLPRSLRKSESLLVQLQHLNLHHFSHPFPGSAGRSTPASMSEIKQF